MKSTKFAQIASIMLAMALTLSCSSGDDGGGNSSGGNNCNGGSGINGGNGKGNDISKYKTKQIGDQVWMLENLNYNVSGSKCGGNDCKLYDENTVNCDKFGRLYNWLTTMHLPPKCNEISSDDEECTINTPHQGICPSGWHIPSNADWDKLMRYVDGTSDISDPYHDRSPYSSHTAGRYLKSKSGWNSGGNGEDKYGFSALPGGNGYSDSFSNVGDLGLWWSSSEYLSYVAYYLFMYNISEYAGYGQYNKNALLSVRCVKD